MDAEKIPVGTRPLNLWNKLLEIQKAVDYLQKLNTGDQYKYVSSSQTLAAIRDTMNEQRLLLLVEVTDHAVVEKVAKSGSVQFFTELSLQFTWINVESPDERLVCPFYAQGVDNSEKGVGKALTYGEKYFLLKFFHIPTDKDDPDSFQDKHSGEGEQEAPTAPERRPRMANPKPGPVPEGHDPYNDPESTMRAEIEHYMINLGEGNMEAGRAILRRETSFRGSDGTTVPGVHDPARLKGKRLEIAHAKLHKLYREAGFNE